MAINFIADKEVMSKTLQTVLQEQQTWLDLRFGGAVRAELMLP